MDLRTFRRETLNNSGNVSEDNRITCLMAAERERGEFLNLGITKKFGPDNPV